MQPDLAATLTEELDRAYRSGRPPTDTPSRVRYLEDITPGAMVWVSPTGQPCSWWTVLDARSDHNATTLIIADVTGDQDSLGGRRIDTVMTSAQ